MDFLIFETINHKEWLLLTIGLIFAPIISLIFFIMKGLYSKYILLKDLPYDINGTWFSAEYDEKGVAPTGKGRIQLLGRNTFLKVNLERKLGNKIIIDSLETLDNLPQEIPTKWKVTAKIVQGDTLVGTWKSTINQSSRHGTCILKFIDQGRAIGFWSGIGDSSYPAYGYWIMSRNAKDVEELATILLEKSGFMSLDLAAATRRYLTPIKKKD